jgi:hypothetical protein
MDILPKVLHVNNKDTFNDLNTTRIRRLLNKDVYLLLVSRETENEYYDLDQFCIKHLNRDMKRMHELMKDVLTNLETLGWKCKYSYNDTGLFIYSSENPPPSCW